jgi:hypothetical protein
VGDRGGLHPAGHAQLGQDVLETCTLAVLGLMTNAWATWRLLRPATIGASNPPHAGSGLAEGAGGDDKPATEDGKSIAAAECDRLLLKRQAQRDGRDRYA